MRRANASASAGSSTPWRSLPDSNSTSTPTVRPASAAPCATVANATSLSIATRTSTRRAKRPKRAALASPMRLYVTRMSRMPEAAITSASPSVWTVMPLAPASTCLRDRRGSLCVLMWGRFAMP